MFFFKSYSTGMFPAKDSAVLQDFMSNTDGKFDDRRVALEKLLLTVCNPQGENKQRVFNDALISVLFTRDYYTTHQQST